ncbi:MAG: hypothetical protein HKN70_08905, partial [Gammaproteobacteria bacterium]|nr:hypothetical protein [Gammaproteobacteria bacterium]
LAAASEFVGGSFSTLVSGPVQDMFITTLKRPAEFAGYDLKTSAETAFDAYLKNHAVTQESIKFIETIIERHGDDPDKAALHGTQLIAEVAGDAAGRRQKGRVPIGRFLDDDAFVAGSGGGMAFVLEPFAESPADIAKLHFHAAREELKAAGRNGYLRIAADRGIVVDNPDLELSMAMLDSRPTDAELGLDKSNNDFERAVVRGRAYLLSGPGRAEILDSIWPGLSRTFFFGAKNYPSQDEWLRTLIYNQKQFDDVLAALKKSNYRFADMALGIPDAMRKHQYLLNNCPEYIGAYMKFRGGLVERMKMFTVANKDRSAAGSIAGVYRTQLAMLDKAQQIELYDLGARQAFLKLQHDALTVNYLAAAGQAIALQNMENQRRVSLGISSRVDLKETAQMFRREARLAATTVVYQGLLAQAAQDLAMHFAFDAIGRMVVAGPKNKWSFLSAETVTRAKLHEQFRNGLNPWSSLFVKDGIYEMVKGGAMDASIMALSQAAATGSVFAASDYNSVLTSIKNLGSKYMEKRGEFQAQVAAHMTERQKADRKIIEDRLASLDLIGVDLNAPVQEDMNRLTSLNEAADKGDVGEVQRLQKELLDSAKNAALNKNRAHYKLLMEGLQDVVERTRILDDEVDSAVTSGPVIETVAAALRAKAQSDGDDANEASTQLAHLEKVKTLRNTFENGKPTIDDLEQLASDRDPLQVRTELLSNAMDIGLIRRALKVTKAAAADNPVELERIDAAAKAIDDHRIVLVNETLAEFFDANPGYRDSTVQVMQGGAATGNPEYQGILADIDFTVLTVAGFKDGAKLKQALEQYFADKGFPLAVGQAASSMDTEAFVQPTGRFDAGQEEFTTIVKDVVVKMGDATRFYSEGGGKWFLNNMAYSGKKLWGLGKFVRSWVTVSRGEAHGLAVDMTRYMSFLTDPKYAPVNVGNISDDKARRDVLTSAMSKTKYFIRLIDAYVMSHPEGNKLYNSRLERRADKGENASYHWQIYKDVETLLANGESTVFNQPGDKDLVEFMAKMKMKGTNPTPWAVLGDGPEAEARAIRLLERMRELTPVILASTAQTYHDEVQDIVKNGTRAQRKEAVSNQYRMASTVRKVLEFDDFGATPMMVPKAVTNKDGSIRVLSREEHQLAVAESMRICGEHRKKLSLYYEINAKIAKHFKDHSALGDDGKLDLEKSRKFREEMDTFIKERYSPEQIAAYADQIGLVSDIEEKYYAWFKYKFHLSDQLLGAR